jgi:Flp pilus assembly protein TadG
MVHSVNPAAGPSAGVPNAADFERLRMKTPHLTPSPVRSRRILAGRRGAVAVELAVLLPFLAFCFVAGTDFCRVFYYVQAVQDAAAAGAVYACQDATTAANTTQITSTAQADASNLSPLPTVTSALGTDKDGNATVSVTATYTFKTITNYPGIPSSTTISRTVTLRVCPP